MVIIVKKISDKESVVANTLNKKRLKAYIDIYKETEFSGLGFLIDEELYVYKYGWGLSFNKETHNFSNNNYLYKSEKKIEYDELENYLLKDLEIIKKEYQETVLDEEQYSIIVKLKKYMNEYSNKELYEKIKDKIQDIIMEKI